jgi:hypothetical protein
MAGDWQGAQDQAISARSGDLTETGSNFTIPEPMSIESMVQLSG